MEDKIIQLSASTEGSFDERLDGLYQQLLQRMVLEGCDADRLMWTRFFMSDAANQQDSIMAHAIYKDVCSKSVCSLIEQPPLDDSKISVMMCFSSGAIERSGSAERCIVKSEGKRFLFQSVRFSADEASRMSVKEQTLEAFQRHIDWLKSEGLCLKDNCLRTWLFVRDIDTNYHDVVVARNEIFAQNGLTADTHFIASTGIGGCGAFASQKVGIDFWSVDDDEMDVKYLQALQYLNPTSEYGVAFERGTVFSSAGVRRALISGTASIDSEGNCLHVGSVDLQIERMFENIAHLLEDGGMTLDDISYMYVYLRDRADFGLVAQYLDAHFGSVPRVVSYAPVCRPQWLIETECVAVKKEKNR